MRRYLGMLVVAGFLAGLSIAPVCAQFGPTDGRDLPPADLNRVAPGTMAPDFTLPAPPGKALTLSDLRGKNVVLVFYRGYW